jgi:poly(3-hydroxybutyrate) depolymerase
MIDTNRFLTRARGSRALARFPLCLTLVVAACNVSPSSSGGEGGSGSGGASSAGGSVSGGASSTGGAGSGGVSGTGGSSRQGTGGAGSGGAPGTGGAGSGGAPGTGGSGSGGAPGTGGRLTGTGGQGAGGQGTGGQSIGTGGSTGNGTGGRLGSGGSTSSGTGGAGAGGATGAGGSTGAVPSVGCGKTSTITFTTVPGESGTNVGTGQGGYVTVNGRGFAMRLPDNYDKNKPYWLIFGFHWNGGTSKDVDTGGSNGYIMAHFGLQKLSNNGAIFVAPQGNNNGWGGDNLPFVDDMVKLITENYCVDTTRLYTNGFSYGGGMSYAIACARAKVFRGAAIYEGAQLSGCTGGNDPIAYWQMAGTTDGTCTIDMATPMRDKFAKNNGCTIPATEPPRPKSISEAHICTDYTGCSSGHPLRWCVHPAGHGNAIVDGTADLYNSCATPPKTCSDTCKCTWVPADVWKFFTSL